MATNCLYKITKKLEKIIERNGHLITFINIPCGKCARCIERRKMEWAFRMEIEMEQSKTAYFVTLTYAPETIPYNDKGRYTLQEKDLNKFWKRLRQNHKRSKTTIEHLTHGIKNNDQIKYYAAGEYGEERGRPHYHAIIFNTSKRAIEKSWELGDVHVVKANPATICYCMKYLDKRLNNTQKHGITPEFNTMSEGIGKTYIDKNKNWHKRNKDALYVRNKKGMMIPMPKYYRHKIFSEYEREEQIIIVTTVLENNKKDEIAKIGHEAYAKNQRMAKTVSEKKFKKKIKKRIVD